jgi:hypothetical protein
MSGQFNRRAAQAQSFLDAGVSVVSADESGF